MVCDISITYSLSFQCSFLQPHEVYFGCSFPAQVFIAKDRAWPHLAVLFLQPHSTTASSMTLSGFCSTSAWSPTQRLGTRQKQHTTVVLCDLATSLLSPSLNLLSWTNSCLSRGFSTKKTLALLYQLTILLPAAIFTERKLFSLSDLDMD